MATCRTSPFQEGNEPYILGFGQNASEIIP